MKMPKAPDLPVGFTRYKTGKEAEFIHDEWNIGHSNQMPNSE